MVATKYGKYIVTELKDKVEAPWATEYKPTELVRLLNLDSNILKGAFYVETTWFLPPVANRTGYDVETHKHDYDEVLAVFGSDLDDPHNLHAELEIWLGGEKHIVTKSCLVFIPKGLEHGPIRWLKMDKPVFHFACGTTKKYF
jgi:hypothetical protein